MKHILIFIDIGIFVISSGTPIHCCIIVTILSKLLKLSALSFWVWVSRGMEGSVWSGLVFLLMNNDWRFNIYRECWTLIFAFSTKNTPENMFILCIFSVRKFWRGEKKTKISQCRFNQISGYNAKILCLFRYIYRAFYLSKV